MVVPLAVFAVRHYAVHINLVEAIPYQNHQPEVVATHIKHRVGKHIVSGAEHLADVMKILKVDVLHGGVPFTQNLFGLRMLLPKLAQRFDGDDVHAQIISN